jgi:DnaD/phage-associated family protein
MTAFTGFPTGKNPYVPIPEVFFTQILPEIEDSAELKVTLHIFWRLAKKQVELRCISDKEMETDKLLLYSLKRRGDPRPVEERLRVALEEAVARGTLLRVNLQMMGENGDIYAQKSVNWYFFNTARSRKVVSALQGGEMIPARMLLLQEEQSVQPPQGVQQESDKIVAAGMYAKPVSHETKRAVQIEVERPNIFVLYEQNIGLLSPLIAEELKDAADHFPMEWIEDAFREAVQHNKRKWSYIRAILRRWETEGRQ